MKTIIGILLVGLLGLLGCSGNDDGTSTFTGEATPVAPFGIIETPTPTYEWTPVPGATKYRLVVQDTNQESINQDTSETAVIDEWYTAEEAGCASEDGLCSVSPDIEVFAKNTWKVQACANEECGLWSGPMNFDFTAQNQPRYADNGDGTVTDNNTKLMWVKNANRCGWKEKWQDAINYCGDVTLAGLSDWRLPSLSELMSLIDPSHRNPALTPGHPFTNVQSDSYWSSSYYYHPLLHDYFAYDVYFGDGWSDPSGFDPMHLAYVWCVRGSN